MTGSGATSRWLVRADRGGDASEHAGDRFRPGGGLDLVEEGPRRSVAVRIGLGIRCRRPCVKREGSVGMRLCLGGRVEGRLEIELRPDRRGHLAGQALADPAGLDERGRKPGMSDLVESGERRLVEADGDLRTRGRRLSEAGDRGGHRLDEDELSPSGYGRPSSASMSGSAADTASSVRVPHSSSSAKARTTRSAVPPSSGTVDSCDVSSAGATAVTSASHAAGSSIGPLTRVSPSSVSGSPSTRIS